MNNKGTKYSLALTALILVLMAANLFFGSVNIPAEAIFSTLTGGEVEKASWSFIVWEARVPQALTALLCGAALAGSGLMLQTAFNNPLAGPSILGINSGASLGVAMVMLLGGGTLATAGITLSGFFSIVLGAFIGSMVVMGIILLVVIIGAGVMLGLNIANSNKELSYEMSEETPGYFYDGEATPELKDDGITAAVNEAYYTNGGHLCVYMTLGNGADKDMRLDTLEVKISNGNTEELIASGYTADVDDAYIVPAGGTNTYTFYIKPEHVKIADDTLETISYEITAVGTLIEE